MTYQFGEDLDLDQLRTNHNISKLFTTPFGKKEGCGYDKASNNKGGSADKLFSNLNLVITPNHFCRASLKSKLLQGGLTNDRH